MISPEVQWTIKIRDRLKMYMVKDDEDDGGKVSRV